MKSKEKTIYRPKRKEKPTICLSSVNTEQLNSDKLQTKTNIELLDTETNKGVKL